MRHKVVDEEKLIDISRLADTKLKCIYFEMRERLGLKIGCCYLLLVYVLIFHMVFLKKCDIISINYKL